LVGDDELEKTALALEFGELVEEGLRAFNVERFHAADWTTGDRLMSGVASIAAAVRTLPMMSPRRVVIVMQAEMLLTPRRESEAATRALEELESILNTPEPQTTLVFSAAAVDKRSRIARLFAKKASVVDCGALEDAGDAERWVRNRVAAAGVEIAPAGARLLAERGGTDVPRLRNDVDRLLLYALGQKTITLDDVRQIVGPESLQDDWALTNAIEAGDGATALRQVALLLDAGAAPEKILGQLGWLVRTKFPVLAARQLGPAVDLLFRTDVELKSSAGDSRMRIERLVVELCDRKAVRRAAR
jgi:DNA polymerase-3 subunit delta